MRILRILLLPFSFLYASVTWIRNRMYDLGLFSSLTASVPVVSIGNLRAGGTGKTPHTEYLIRQLADEKKILSLSRGYGRKSKGFILAGETTSVLEIGDEPYQFFKKFGNKISVAVGENRAEALKKISGKIPETELVLLDDAFQHRAVKADLNILLTEFERPFYRDFPYPAGLLREGRREAARADMVVVTKCPASPFEREKIRSRIAEYAGKDKPVFFTSIAYSDPVSIHGLPFPVSEKIVALTGIANPRPFLAFLNQKHSIRRHFRFPDHHWFSGNEIREIVECVLQEAPGTALVTTEKDFMRMDSPGLRKPLEQIPVFYYPVKVKFLDEEEKFMDLVRRSIQKKSDF